MYHVLIVDDEPRVVDALIANVDWEDCGVSLISRADSCSRALETLESGNIDILISDIEMPNGSGLQLLQTLRETGNEIPCIYITCHPEFDYMRTAIQMRCHDYILKPIDYEEFSRVLKRLVQQLREGEARVTVPEQTEKTDPAPDREQKMADAVMEYIRLHMEENITVTEIAGQMHFNPQYLMRMFKKKTGVSIVEYITGVRMDAARALLGTTDMPIHEIATAVGYGDFAYFTRVFRKETGFSPSQFRKNKQK